MPDISLWMVCSCRQNINEDLHTTTIGTFGVKMALDTLEHNDNNRKKNSNRSQRLIVAVTEVYLQNLYTMNL